ncbi:MAG: hypothetical protein IIC25_08825 [Chloroflexi bacterium]|nr:hypothetical protein [Chloroflexota bacterium]
MEQASSAPQRREIDLHRRVCVITREGIDIKPARSAAILPLFGFMLGVGAFVAVLFLIEELPFFLVLALMGVAIILVPFSGMGFVYSIWGANVVINREKQTALWQQGLFGMGVGTEELVPFHKIERFEVQETSPQEQQGRAQEFAQFDITLLKKSGKRLSLGQVTVPRASAAAGLARARTVGEAASAMTGKPFLLPGGGRRRRRGRRRPSPSATG